MMSPVVEGIREVVLPILASHDVELYDVEISGALVRVVVDRETGVDLETLGGLTRAISRALDDADPIAGRYTLEVTSPGVERPLRTPEQFARAIGDKVKIRTVPSVEGDRRVEGMLATADGEGITIRTDQVVRSFGYDEIERARTVFEWGTPGPKPGQTATSPGSRKKRERRS
jgi:ribosome maturation factor RimP